MDLILQYAKFGVPLRRSMTSWRHCVKRLPQSLQQQPKYSSRRIGLAARAEGNWIHL
jgi:hypothetical protein